MSKTPVGQQNPAAGMPGLPARDRIVLIIGETGTGKSKLAVDLATKFNGEIINADAVQMYKGFPIMTNKIPSSERMNIRHHLLNVIEYTQKPWTVHDFVGQATRIIEEIRGRGRLPIVVGGTSYYVQSLLFKDSTIVGSEQGHEGEMDDGKFDEEGLQRPGRIADMSVLEDSNEAIYAKLKEVDPVMASKWHPNDRRKVQRSLEIWFTTGKKPSEIYAAQQEAKKESITGDQSSAVRYDPLIFWLGAEDAVLKARLDTRVDKMIQQGLLQEVTRMRNSVVHDTSAGVPPDQTSGLWIAIGYHQLSPWADAVSAEDDTAAIEKRLSSGIEAMKAATRQYAKRQNRWIRIRFANALKEASILSRLFLLDSTELDRWDDNVGRPSSALLHKFWAGEQLPESSSLSELAATMLDQVMANGEVVRKAHYCEICDKTLMNEQEMHRHLTSQGHKKVVAGNRKRQKRDEYLAKHSGNG